MSIHPEIYNRIPPSEMEVWYRGDVSIVYGINETFDQKGPGTVDIFDEEFNSSALSDALISLSYSGSEHGGECEYLSVITVSPELSSVFEDPEEIVSALLDGNEDRYETPDFLIRRTSQENVLRASSAHGVDFLVSVESFTPDAINIYIENYQSIEDVEFEVEELDAYGANAEGNRAILEHFLKTFMHVTGSVKGLAADYFCISELAEPEHFYITPLDFIKELSVIRSWDRYVFAEDMVSSFTLRARDSQQYPKATSMGTTLEKGLYDLPFLNKDTRLELLSAAERFGRNSRLLRLPRGIMLYGEEDEASKALVAKAFAVDAAADFIDLRIQNFLYPDQAQDTEEPFRNIGQLNIPRDRRTVIYASDLWEISQGRFQPMVSGAGVIDSIKKIVHHNPNSLLIAPVQGGHYYSNEPGFGSLFNDRVNVGKPNLKARADTVASVIAELIIGDALSSNIQPFDMDSINAKKIAIETKGLTTLQIASAIAEVESSRRKGNLRYEVIPITTADVLNCIEKYK